MPILNKTFEILNKIDTSIPMTPSLKIILAFIIGNLGSLSYVLAVYFGFVGDDKDRDTLLKHFRNHKGRISIFKTISYCFIGGFLAVIFQLLSYGFAPIQAFLAGVGWPMFVYNNISPRQANRTNEINELAEKINKGSIERKSEEINYDSKMKKLMEELSNE